MHLRKRGEYWTAYWWWKGKKYCRSTGVKNLRSAQAIASNFVDAQKDGRTELLERTKLRRTAPTIGNIISAYLESAVCRKKTAEHNVRIFKFVLKTVGISETGSVMQLSAHFGNDFSREAKKIGWSAVAIRSAMRQARSIFSKEMMVVYGLSDVPEWLSVSLPSADWTGGFVPIPHRIWCAICRDVIGLRDSATYRAFLLMSRCGMSNREVKMATGEWLVENGIRVDRRSDFEPKSHNRIRLIPMKPVRFNRYFKSLMGSSERLVPDGEWRIFNELNPILRKHLPNRKKAAYELRKHAGSIIATRDGIFAAAKFLGDRVDTTERYYAALLKPLKPI